MILLPLCLVACADSQRGTEGAPIVDVRQATKAEDLTDNALFDFELTHPTGHPAVPTGDTSNLLAMLGADALHFPGNAQLGLFKLGMSSQEVEQIAKSQSLAIEIRQSPDDTGVDCTKGAGQSSAPVVLHAIPASYNISLKSGETYTINFIDDAGRARISEIQWSPDAATYRRPRWQAYLLKTFGQPTFRSGGATTRPGNGARPRNVSVGETGTVVFPR